MLAGPVLVHLAVRVDLDGLPRDPDLAAPHQDDVVALGVVARARRRGEGHPLRRAGGGAHSTSSSPSPGPASAWPCATMWHRGTGRRTCERRRDVVAFHATDPSTVFLSCLARVDGVEVADVRRVLEDDRTLVKDLGMRRTNVSGQYT